MVKIFSDVEGYANKQSVIEQKEIMRLYGVELKEVSNKRTKPKYESL